MTDTRTESQIQSSFIRMCGWAHLEPVIAIPNGAKFGSDSRLRAMQNAKLVREGRRLGVSDVEVPVPRHGFGSLWIEFKARREKPTPEQVEWIDLMNRVGNLAVWTRSDEKAFEFTKGYLDAGASLAILIPWAKPLTDGVVDIEAPAMECFLG